MADVIYYDQELECMSRPQLEAYQLGKLRHQLNHVYERSPLYRRKLDEAQIKPDDIRTMADIGRIPLTEKEELQQSQRRFSGNPRRRREDKPLAKILYLL